MSKYFPDDCYNCKTRVDDICQMNTFPKLKTIIGRAECPNWRENGKENKE